VDQEISLKRNTVMYTEIFNTLNFPLYITNDLVFMHAKSNSLSYLCKYCGSENITETEYGYVCRNCATDQGRKRYKSTTSYNRIRFRMLLPLKLRWETIENEKGLKIEEK
jgi:hypothetical protein